MSLSSRDKIYDKCLNINMEFAGEIDDLVEDVITEQRNKHIEKIDKIQFL